CRADASRGCRCHRRRCSWPGLRIARADGPAVAAVFDAGRTGLGIDDLDLGHLAVGAWLGGVARASLGTLRLRDRACPSTSTVAGELELADAARRRDDVLDVVHVVLAREQTRDA